MMNERELPAEVPGRVLKSLLKKPGQTRTSRGHKNRVVINEKLNEFFAADYIILIKEECCADYEEECDCCCQEPEMIRLGNCKECRADVTRNMSNSNDITNPHQAYENKSRNGDVRGMDCDVNTVPPAIRRDHRQMAFGSEESQEEDDEEEEEEEEDDDEEEGEEDEEDEEEDDDDDEEIEDSDENDKCRRSQMTNCNMINCVSSLQKIQERPQQQQETLSPPEGYKDVCDEDATLVGDEQQQQLQQRLVCGECNYYHRQKIAGSATDYNNDGKSAIRDDETTSGKEIVRHGEDDDQPRSDQAQQTTPDLHQRYLVETITMTTVTERRIVREISEEETRPVTNENSDTVNANDAIENTKNHLEKNLTSEELERENYDDTRSNDDDNENTGKSPQNRQKTDETEINHTSIQPPRETNDPSELSLTFKLGNHSLGLNNSLKPNSAVRQLFPDPRFISPPPAPTKAISSTLNLSHDEATDSDSSEAQQFLITTESLRLFDAVKRSKMAGSSRSDSSESETSSIKRTIERNALRRSLICKYETSTRKKNLRSKDLTLEERIRQLTCVDQDDDNTGGSSASETGVPTTTTTMTTGTTASIDTVDNSGEFPVRTSPSGEERPSKQIDTRLCSSRIATSGATSDIQETLTSTTLMQQQTTANPHNNHHHHQHHHHHHHQSTYKRITDLFAQKKMIDANLPDIGLGDKSTLGKEYATANKSTIAKMNSDARKQFLASLAPLSCVASTGVENREDYYQLSSKQLTSNTRGNDTVGNRDSVGYNSDSSYSLEDIEAALRGEERNYKNSGGPPDVTRGTPTGNGPETLDPTTDELLAFVEQDKTRNERIRRRYNEIEQNSSTCSSACNRNDENLALRSDNRDDGTINQSNDHNDEDDDEDDELNDYGFNRRPSVRGIKPQFEKSSEIVRQLRSRSAISVGEKTRGSFHACPPWPYYEINGETTTGNEQQQTSGTTFLLAAPPIPAMPVDETADDQRSTLNPDCQLRSEDTTINRINTMQKQIDDIYQTIAETATTVQLNHERGNYHEGTLPRAATRGINNDSCHRYSLQEQTHLGVNGTMLHYHDQVVGGRMLRIAGGGDGSTINTAYNTLPTKSRRPQSIGNYPCAVSTIQQQVATNDESNKCYRTMYLVPYNGITDPTYQNIQRILPPHSSPNYANHIERYPYPRNGRMQEQTGMLQQHQLPTQQPRAYYTRTLPGVNAGNPGNLHGQPGGLHLHLHGQNDDFRFTGAANQQHPMQAQLQQQQQHHQHTNQMSGYNTAQTIPTYTVLAPNRPNGYPYGVHSINRSSAADVQTQTVSSPNASTTSNCGTTMLNNTYNTSNTGQNIVTSSTSNSSTLASPTKLQQSRNNSCNVAERGVPEGAASAPSQDYTLTNNTLHTLNNTFHTGNNVPPPNTQNSVYYAMNV